MNRKYKVNSEKKNFIVREREPFTCGNCGEELMGGRYVNHCPRCLWSKHVDDRIPGDRSSLCGGLMKPIGVKQKGSKWRITHECVECQKEMIVDSHPDDNFDEIIKLAQKPLQK